VIRSDPEYRAAVDRQSEKHQDIAGALRPPTLRSEDAEESFAGRKAPRPSWNRDGKMCGRSVSRVLFGAPWRPSMTIPLAVSLPIRSSCQPGPLGLKHPCPALARRGARPLFGIAPGGACRAASVARRAVGFYPTVSPLPRRDAGAVCFLWRFPSGCPGRALPGTFASWSPDFPRTGRYLNNRPLPPRGHPTFRTRVLVHVGKRVVKRVAHEARR